MDQRSARLHRVPLLGLDVAAEDHQGLDGFRDELGRQGGVREGVRTRADRLTSVGGADRKDLGLDHAGVAVVDRAEHGDRATVLARVTDEQLALAGLRPGWTAMALMAMRSRRPVPPSPGRRIRSARVRPHPTA